MSSKPCWIFYGTNEQNVKFVKEQIEPNYGIEIARWIGGLPEDMSKVKKIFPEIKSYSFNEFNSIVDLTAPIDADFFAFYDYKTIYLLENIFRRSKFFYNYSIPFDEQNHCIQVAQFVLRNLKSDRIQTVLFFEFPHTIGAYITYLVCKFLDIQTIIRALSPFENRVFYTSRIEDGIPDYFNLIEPLEEEIVKQILLKADQNYDNAQPSYTKKQRQRRFLVSKILRFRTYLAQRQWKKLFQSLVSKMNQVSQGKFVYVGLHYQPELTSFPLGGIYNNQHIMVMMLSAVIPDDWEVVIKEHPTTFKYIKKNMTLYRSKQYYKSLKSIPKVKFIDHEYDSFELIDKAACVATLTGTLGFESVLRGKSCLVFGDAPYLGCDGVYRVVDYESLESAFNDMQKRQFHVDKVLVKEFVRNSYTNTLFAKTNLDWDNFDVEKHAAYIGKLLEGY